MNDLATAQFWIENGIVLLGAGGFVTLLTLWRDRRKAEAEAKKAGSEAGLSDANALEIIQRTAGNEVMRIDKALQEEREARLEDRKVSRIRKRAGSKMYDFLLDHEEWDNKVIAKFAELGVEIERPPTLRLTDEEKEALEV